MTGTGTADDPYVIMTLEQLDAVRKDLTAHYRLGADIDASDTKDWNDGQGWKPIGDADHAFIGEFDGAGHVIRGLTIDRPDETNVGLFGIVGSYPRDGTIRNVGLENVSVIGNSSTGGLAGRILDGTVEGCYVNGTVTGTGTYTYTGGLVGWNDGMIVASHASGSVDGQSSVGGLAGMNNGGDIIRSYAESVVTAVYYTAGGLLGVNQSGAVSLTYATGTVQADSVAGGLVGFTDYGGVEKSYATGAVVGRIYTAGLIASNNGGGLWDSFWDAESTGQPNACNNADWGPSCEATQLSTAQALAQSSYVGLDFNSDWFMIDGSTRPFLRSEWSESIRNAHQLQLMAMDLTADYALAGDIDFGTTFTDASRSDMWATSADEGSGFKPIGKSYGAGLYSGVFDGGGHVIRNLTIVRPGENPVGLFGMIGASSSDASDTSGIVRNVGLEEGRVAGGDNTGALVGYNNAGTVESAYSTVKVDGSRYVGGLVGTNGNASTVSRSYAAGDVNGVRDVGGLIGYQLRLATGGITSQSFAAGQVAGENEVGGLIGTNDTGLIELSYATGGVTGESNVGGLVGITNDFSKITQSYAAGRVAGTGDLVGGLAGSSSGSIDDSNFYDRDATGQSDTGKGIPLPTAEMKRWAAYASQSWDPAVWSIGEGQTYPTLQGVTPDALRDAAPPTVASAAIENANPLRVAVAFDEAVELADAGGLAIAADGSAVGVARVEGAGTNTIFLDADRPFEIGQDVRLSYDQAAGTIADEADNPLRSFADLSVANGSLVGDETPPSIAAEMKRADGSAYVDGSWTNASVTVSVYAEDEAAGVASIAYSVDGGPEQAYANRTPIEIADEGAHTLLFRAADAAGNEASKELAVNIDKTPPNIVLNGSNPLRVPLGSTYEEPGAAATDALEGTLPPASIAISGVVDTGAIGHYPVVYTASDQAGNAASVTRDVYVYDGDAPAIWLNGPAEMTIEANEPFADPGATAVDGHDGDLTASIVVTGTVDTSRLGDYALSYDVLDSAGNAAPTVIRSVYVRDTRPPVLTLLGDASVELKVGEPFADPGATAEDAYYGDLTGSIAVTGDVDTSKPGEYTLRYDVADPSGNKAEEATRTVKVVSAEEPGDNGDSPGGDPGQSSPPPVVANPAASVTIDGASVFATVTEEARSDGRSAVRIALDASALSSMLASRSVTVIAVRTNAALVQVDLPAPALLEALKNNPNAVVQVQAAGATYSLPLSLLASIAPKETVSIVIGQASDAAAAAANEAASQAGVRLLLDRPVEFSLLADGKEAADWGGVYVTRTLQLPSGVDAEQATAAWIDSAGNLRFVPSVFSASGGTTTVTIYAPHDSLYTVIESHATFADLQGHWAQADAEAMAGKRIAEGVSETAFAPDAFVTRAEFAALLARSLGLADTAEGSLFADVPADSWYADAVAAARKAGLIDGYSDGSFRPDARITREQMAVMIARALRFAGKPAPNAAAGGDALGRFADRESVSPWAEEAVSGLLAAGLMQGLTGTTFAPDADATRAQSVVLLKRMLQYAGFINE